MRKIEPKHPGYSNGANVFFAVDDLEGVLADRDTAIYDSRKAGKNLISESEQSRYFDKLGELEKLTYLTYKTVTANIQKNGPGNVQDLVNAIYLDKALKTVKDSRTLLDLGVIGKTQTTMEILKATQDIAKKQENSDAPQVDVTVTGIMDLLKQYSGQTLTRIIVDKNKHDHIVAGLAKAGIFSAEHLEESIMRVCAKLGEDSTKTGTAESKQIYALSEIVTRVNSNELPENPYEEVTVIDAISQAIDEHNKNCQEATATLRAEADPDISYLGMNDLVEVATEGAALLRQDAKEDKVGDILKGIKGQPEQAEQSVVDDAPEA